MTIVLVLAIAGIGAAGTAYSLPLGGRVSRAATIGGVLALLLIALLAGTGLGPGAAPPGPDLSAVPGAAWGGALVPGHYVRLVVGLAALAGAMLSAIAWLLDGLPGLTGLLPSLFVALAGTTVALAASTPFIAAMGATGAGLAAVPVLLAGTRAGRTGAALQEVRTSLVTAAAVVAVAAVGSLAARLVFANPTGTGATSTAGPIAAVGLATVVLSLVVAARVGSVPFHLRLTRLADAAPAIGLPLLAAWIPLPLGAVALTVMDGTLAPLALPLGTERVLLVVLALIGLGGASLAAYVADDLRHSVAYLTAADGAFVLVGLAALEPATWEPVRAWLLIVLVSKTALAAWSAVVEDRFGTRGVPDLRGWARRAPVLAVALVLVALATFGVPGWVAFEIRATMPGYALDGVMAAVMTVVSFLTLPTYLRILLVGIGPTASHVERANPERFRQHLTGRVARFRVGRGQLGLPVRLEGGGEVAATTVADAEDLAGADAGGAASATAGPMRARSAVSTTGRAPQSLGPGVASLHAPAGRGRPAVPSIQEVLRGRTELLSAAVLVLALLAALVALGAFDVASAATEAGPAAIVAGIWG